MSFTNMWEAMSDVANKHLFEKVSPNQTLVEEALSFNVSGMDHTSDELLRKYTVVLGQYLITLKYQENKLEAMARSWQKALDARVYVVLQNRDDIPNSLKTVSDRRMWAISNDNEANSLSEEVGLSEAQCGVIKNMSKPVEQYINTLKKEIDARENDRKYGGV